MTESMEKLQEALNLGRVPAVWQKYAYDTMKQLVGWFADLLVRIDHYQKWGDLIVPNPT